MQTIVYQITDPRGIHARPAGQLVKLVSGYKSACQIGKAGQLVDGKRLLVVMKLAIQQGEELTMTFDGPDEVEAAAAAQNFLQQNL